MESIAVDLNLKMLQSFNFDNQFIGKRCFKSFSRRTPTWKWRELLFVSLRAKTADFLFICRCRWWQGTSWGEWFSAEGPVAFRTILSISAAFVSSGLPPQKGPFGILRYVLHWGTVTDFLKNVGDISIMKNLTFTKGNNTILKSFLTSSNKPSCCHS